MGRIQRAAHVVRYGVAWRTMPHDLRVVLRLASGHAEEPLTVVLGRRTLRSAPASGARAAGDCHKCTRGSALHAAANTLNQVLALHHHTGRRR